MEFSIATVQVATPRMFKKSSAQDHQRGKDPPLKCVLSFSQIDARYWLHRLANVDVQL